MRRLTSLIVIVVVLGGFTSVATAGLLLDFNSLTQDSGPNIEAGYDAYNAGHETSADFDTKNYNVTFATAGAATVSVTPAWPNTVDNRVRQMIDRWAGNDVNWVGNNLDLLTDWIGSDSRTSQGGNGDWDRTGATTPTFMTLTLGGLPAGTYDWLSYHHDTESMWSDFQVEVSVNGGLAFGAASDMQMTPSSQGSFPPSPSQYTGFPDPDPKNLPSTFTTSFDADGVNDVILRFAPFTNGIDPTGVHKQLFGLNGFELTQAQGPQVPEPSAFLVWAGFIGLGLTAWKNIRRHSM